MRHSIIAPICSAFILPGLGQIINRQLMKGIGVIVAITILFLAILVKFVLDLSAVMSEVLDQTMFISGKHLPQIIAGLRARNLTPLYVLLLLGVMVWAYSVFDAYIQGRRFQTPPEENA